MQKAQMTPRERVLTTLKLGQADRVPWVESYIHSSLVNKILGREVTAIPGARIAPQIHEKLCLDNITYDFRPPIYAEVEKRGDLEMIRQPWLKGWGIWTRSSDGCPTRSPTRSMPMQQNILSPKGTMLRWRGFDLV